MSNASISAFLSILWLILPLLVQLPLVAICKSIFGVVWLDTLAISDSNRVIVSDSVNSRIENPSAKYFISV
jgi:hypothetical protein